MDATSGLGSLAISAGLGLINGLQRQRSGSALAGIRTFPLIAILGTLCAILSDAAGGWVLAAGLVSVALATAMGNYLRSIPDRSPGITTEIAILVMFAVGAMVWTGPREVAVAAGIGSAILLAFKAPMHALAARISEDDLRAILRFAVIAFVVLPVVPDRAMGPLDAINPHQTWLMVVLVVGISLAGYIAYLFIPAHRATIVTGLLGGLVSSTATTADQSRGARVEPGQEAANALVILLASVVVFARVLFEIAIVGPGVFWAMSQRLVVMLAAGILVAIVLWARTRSAVATNRGPSNPSNLRSALVFAGLFTVVSVLVAVARREFGDAGLQLVAMVSGLTDMDAITLNTARLAQEGTLAPGTAGRAVLLASVTNLMFKGVIVGVLGGWGLLRRLVVPMGVLIAIGTALAMA